MIVAIVDNMCIAVYELKKYPPISGDPYRMETLFISGQLMKERARINHIFYIASSIEPVEYPFKSPSVFRPDSLFAPCVEKIFKTFMFE